MTMESGWCLDRRHRQCRFAKCDCFCHRTTPDDHPEPDDPPTLPIGDPE